MQILDHPAPVQALDITSLIRRQKLTAADKGTLRSTCQRIARSLDLIESNRPSKSGHYSRLEAAAATAEREAAGNPTPESVERLHRAVTRHHEASTSFSRIDAALNAAVRREIDSLAALANRLLDSTAKALDDEGSKRMKEITQADSVFGEAGDGSEFQRRLDATRANLADERQAVNQEGAALSWLCRHGFTADPFRDPSAFLVDDADEDIAEALQADFK